MLSGSFSSNIFRAVTVCGIYCLLSSWSVMYSKFILSSVFYNSNCLLLVQNVFTLLVLLVFRYFGFVDFSVKLHSVTDWAVGVTYSMNVVFGLWSLSYLTVPAFSALKRCNILVVWVIEAYAARKPSTDACVPPLFVLLMGTVMMSIYDLHFSVEGYTLAALSCVMQGLSLEFGRRFAEKSTLCSVLMMNSLAMTVVQMILLLFTHEWATLFGAFSDPKVLFHLFFNSFSCLVLNYVIFLNCTVNSPLAHTVTGNVKAIITTAFGIIFFSVVIPTAGYVGITLSFIGGGWFSAVKYHFSKLKEKKQDVL